MKIKLIPHSHWDREWYFTIEDSKILSTFMFDKILSVLEKDKDFPNFCLDGQISIVEDYLEHKPHNEDRLKKLVKDKRLSIGPWYTQTDSFYVNTESFIKNLYFGTMKAEQLGHSMSIGYLPDTFGHNAQTPQLFNGFDINNIIFWRGLDTNVIKKPYFNWKSLAGDEILAINFTFGYGAAKWLENDVKHWEEKIMPMVEEIEKINDFELCILPSGGDQVLIDETLPKIIKSLNKWSKEHTFEISDYESFVNDLKAEIKVKKIELEQYQGELRTPEVGRRVHRTIGASRYDLKQLNSKIEHKIINVLEPLSIVYESLTGDKINNKTFELIWKLTLDGHAHDSLGACNTDITNENIIIKFKRALSMIDGLINVYEKRIGSNLKELNNTDLVLYNFDIQNFNRSKDLTLFSKFEKIDLIDLTTNKKIDMTILNVEKISGGRKILLTTDGEKEVEVNGYYKHTVTGDFKIPNMWFNEYKVQEAKEILLATSGTKDFIENDLYKISINKNQINLLNKKTNQKIENYIAFQDEANDGDSYDFSPIKDDKVIDQITIKSYKSISSKQKSILKINFCMKVPKELEESRSTRSKDLVCTKGELEILLSNSSVINHKLQIHNKAKDHQMKVIFNSGLVTEDITTDVPFGYLDHKMNQIDKEWRSKKTPEYPVDIFPINHSSYIKEDDKTFSCFVKGMKNIQAVNDKDNTKVHLTLFKSDGALGKNDLLWRPHRASGINNVVVPTPDAQLLHKDLSFRFGVSYNGNIDQSEVTKLKNEFNPMFDYYQFQALNTFKDRLERFQVPLPTYKMNVKTILKDELEDFEYSSLYKSHKTDKYILRVYNLNDKKEIKLSNILKNYQTKSFVKMNETTIKGDSIIVPKYGSITIAFK